MNNLPILNNDIRQTGGLYCLDDLHKANGIDIKKTPSRWLENKRTQALISALENQNGQICLFKNPGKNGDTFACKELALAYGMWASPALCLAVINELLKGGGETPHPFQTNHRGLQP